MEMDGIKKEDTQQLNTSTENDQRYYIPSVKKLRLVLIPFAILYTFGIFPALGDISNAVFGFAFPAMYIVSGYLVLRQAEDIEQRIRRAIKRTAICFVIMFVVYSGCSLLYDFHGTVELFTQASFWKEFLLFNMCTLPVGSTIWYVQALLYAYIIIYLLHKLKLLKFDIYIAVLCLVFTVLSGELSSVIGFNFLGHSFIVGNFLTRALPYLLIGCFIDRKKEFFNALSIPDCIGMIFIGIVMSIAEYTFLNITGNKVYVGHLLGMGLIAVAISLFPFYSMESGLNTERLGMLTRYELAVPYFVCSPIFVLLVKLVLRFGNPVINAAIYNYLGIITLFVSMVALYVYFCIRLLMGPFIFKFIKKK